jgi:hypothetical protein
MSSLIASRNLRRFSATRSSSVSCSILESLVTPSTSRAISVPKFFSMSVLDRVVEHRGDDGLLVELEVGHQASHFDRMAEVRVAAGALLGAVLLHRIDIGAVEQRLVGVGVVGLDPFHKFVLAQH